MYINFLGGNSFLDILNFLVVAEIQSLGCKTIILINMGSVGLLYSSSFGF